MATVTATCTAVLRAETGPCQAKLMNDSGDTCGCEPSHNCHGPLFACPGYLGPSLGVCGHPKSEHRGEGELKVTDGEGRLVDVPAHCETCWGNDELFIEEKFTYRDHAFTTPSEPVSAP